MKFEPELVQRLIQAKCLSQVADPKGFALELTTDKGVYMARVSKDQINDLYKRSKAGDVEAMYVVSALYDLGIGVPEDHQAASNWANFSTLQGGTATFADAAKKLKTDIANSSNVVKDGFVYPEKYTKVLDRFKKFLAFGIYESIDMPKGSSIRVAPALSGVHVAFCYKRVRANEHVKGTYEYVLYDAWTLEENRALPMLSHFASRLVPMKLGEWLNGDRVTHSNTVGIEGNYVFVYGTLAVRKDKIPALKANLPEAKSVRALLDMYISAPVRSTKLFDENELKPLRDAYVRAKKKFDKKPVYKNEYREARKAYREAKENFEAQRDAWAAKQPESYIDFVAYDMVGYSKGEILHITDIARRYLKLQTAAFIPPKTRDYDYSSLPAIIDPSSFRKHHRATFEHLKETIPYRMIGLEVLQLDPSGMNADSRIIYRVKE
ncbi:MAG: hypothetical protein ACKVIS_22785 [Pseudomonadales bacterium]